MRQFHKNKLYIVINILLGIVVLCQPVTILFAADPGFLPPADQEAHTVDTWQGGRDWHTLLGINQPAPQISHLPHTANSLMGLVPAGYTLLPAVETDNQAQITLSPTVTATGGVTVPGTAVTFFNQHLMLLIASGTFSAETRLIVEKQPLAAITGTKGATPLVSEDDALLGIPGYRQELVRYRLRVIDIQSGTDIDQFVHPIHVVVDIHDLAGINSQTQSWSIALAKSGNDNQWETHETIVHHPDGLLSTTVSQTGLFAVVDENVPVSWHYNWIAPTAATFSGAATFTYPIDVPPGRQNLQPNLAVSYNSRALDFHILSPEDQGALGLGFSLSEISIVRSGVEISGGNSATFHVKYHPDFALNIQGQNYELMRTSAVGIPENGTEVTTYMAVNAPGLSIKQVYDPTLSNGNPDRLYWLVQTPSDGTTYRLGYTHDAAKGQFVTPNEYGKGNFGEVFPNEQHFGYTSEWGAQTWYVDTVTDVYGNQIQYDYYDQLTNPQGQYRDFDIAHEWNGSWLHADMRRPKEIRYNFANLAPNPQTRVSSSYASKISFTISGYDTGAAEDPLLWRVDKIQIYHLDMSQPYREVDFGLAKTEEFTCSQFTNTHRLDSIQVSGHTPQGSIYTLPATQFSYQQLIHYPDGGEGCFPYAYLQTVDNGYHGQVHFTYANDGHYRDGEWGQLPLYGYSYYVTQVNSTTSIPGGISKTAVVTYQPSNPCYDQVPEANTEETPWVACANRLHASHTAPDGPLVGFADTMVRHYDFGETGGRPPLQKTQIHFHQDARKMGRTAWQKLFNGNDVLLQEQTFSYQLDSSSLWDFTYLQQQCRTDYSQNGQPTQHCTNTTYDPAQQGGVQYGNLTSSTETTNDCTSSPCVWHTRTIQRNYFPNLSTWVVGVVAREQMLDDGMVVAETRYYYDDNLNWNQMPATGKLRQVEQMKEASAPPIPGKNQMEAITSYPTYIVTQQMQYDAYGNVTTTTDARGKATTTTYDNSYHLYPISITNPLGQTQQITYYGLNATGPVATHSQNESPPGTLAQQIDANNFTTHYAYDPFGRLNKVFRGWIEQGSNWDSPSTMYLYFDYGPFNRLSFEPFWIYSWQKTQDNAVAAFEGGTFTREFYDGFGNLLQTQQPHTDWYVAGGADGYPAGHRVITDYQYDALGNVIAQSEPYFWDANPNQTTSNYVTPALVQQQRTQYDALSRPVRTVDFGGSVTSSLYGPRSATVQDANNHLQTTLFDVVGRVTAVDETLSTFADMFSDGNLDGWEQQGAVTVTGGVVTLIGQNTWDNPHLTRSLSPQGEGGVSFSFKGNTDTLLAALFLEHGATSWPPPADYRRWEVHVQNQEIQLVEYTGSTATTARLMPFAANTWYRVLLRGGQESGEFVVLVWEERNPDNMAEVRLDKSDLSGWQVSDWDFRAQVYTADTVLSLDNYDELSFNRTHYQYDSQDNLTHVFDPLENETEMVYDALGRKRYMSDPDMGAWYYNYDNMGNLISQFDNKQQTISFVYDDLNRLHEKRLTNSSGPLLASYSYDATNNDNKGIGQRTGMTAYDPPGVAHNSASWRYDAMGRMTQETRQVAGSSYTFQFGYTQGDVPVTMIYPDGEQVTTHYWWTTAQPKDMVGTSWYVGTNGMVGATYSQTGQLTSLRLGNGKTSNYNYDAAFRLQRIVNDSGQQDIEYQYDAVSNLTLSIDHAFHDSWGNPFYQYYSYDSLNRLVHARGDHVIGAPNYDEDYSYDALGNLVNKAGMVMGYGQGTGMPPGVMPHAVTHLNGIEEYQYDGNANMVLRPDANGNGNWTLTWTLENLLRTVSNNQHNISYSYDADGVLVRRVEDGQGVTYLGKLYQRADDGEVTKHYQFNGQEVAVRVGSSVSFILSDRLGSSTVTLYANGTLQSKKLYDPWGQEYYSYNIMPTGYQYTGQRWDNGVQLYDYQARYYDPAIGRFISADTIVPNPTIPQSFNRFAYTRNNPVKYIDETGHEESVYNPNELVGDDGEVIKGSMLDELDQTIESLQAIDDILHYGPQVLAALAGVITAYLQQTGTSLPSLVASALAPFFVSGLISEAAAATVASSMAFLASSPPLLIAIGAVLGLGYFIATNMLEDHIDALTDIRADIYANAQEALKDTTGKTSVKIQTESNSWFRKCKVRIGLTDMQGNEMVGTFTPHDTYSWTSQTVSDALNIAPGHGIATP